MAGRKVYGNTIYYFENGCLGVCEKYFGERITIWFWLSVLAEKHLNECYLLFRECGLGCLGVRSILARGLEFGLGLDCLS